MSNKFITLDLGRYFNCKYIIKIDEMDKAKKFFSYIGAQGELISANSIPYFSKNILIQNIQFNFPEITYNKYDSISCEEQLIAVPMNCYTSIHLLVTGISDKYHEILTIIFEDGTTCDLNIDFKFSHQMFANASWNYDVYNSTPAIVGMEILKKLNTNRKTIIYYSTSNIFQVTKKIKYLKLPYNPNALIFSITLVL